MGGKRNQITYLPKEKTSPPYNRGKWMAGRIILQNAGLVRDLGTGVGVNWAEVGLLLIPSLYLFITLIFHPTCVLGLSENHSPILYLFRFLAHLFLLMGLSRSRSSAPSLHSTVKGAFLL